MFAIVALAAGRRDVFHGCSVCGCGRGPAGLPSSCLTSQSRPSRLSRNRYFSVVLRMSKNADWSSITAIANLT